MSRHLRLIAFAIVTFTFAAAASAQYVWTDERGVKQFSDAPPPASVPKSRILREPGKSQRSPAHETPTANATTDTAAKPPLTTAERNAEFQKRKMEREEKEKKEADLAKQTADRAKNCDRAQTYQKSLESGTRIASTDKNGERSIMGDDDRAREMRENRRLLDGCK